MLKIPGAYLLVKYLALKAEGIVKQVTAIEEQLGITSLEQFTP
jgi:hypothetical protein